MADERAHGVGVPADEIGGGEELVVEATARADDVELLERQWPGMDRRCRTGQADDDDAPAAPDGFDRGVEDGGLPGGVDHHVRTLRTTVGVDAVDHRFGLGPVGVEAP